MMSSTAQTTGTQEQPPPSLPWTGRVVGRLLPRRADGGRTAAAAAPVSVNKPIAARIDPSLLKPGTGARHRHPDLGEVRRQQKQYACGAVSPVSTTPKDEVVRDDLEDCVAEFEIHLYGNTPQQQQLQGNSSAPDDDKGDSEEYILLHMDRDPEESLSKTLQRMQLSIHKKLMAGRKGSGKRSKKAKGNQQQQQQRAARAPSLWAVDESGGEAQVDGDVLDNLTNAQLLEKATTTPYVALVHHQALPQSQDELQQQEQIRLVLESCPPTVAEVQTYQDFGAHLFAGVPVAVRVSTRFAAACRVDWYVDRQLVQRDSSVYVPRQQDIGKTVSVLLTPVSSSCPDGHGYEEAYRFPRKVEPLPENRILDLRSKGTPNIWTTAISLPCERRDQESEDAATTPSTIRVVTYNVLADQNAFVKSSSNSIPFYKYCTVEMLDRSRRLPLVAHELLSYRSDLMCLQEVDEIAYDTLFKPLFAEYGYDGRYACKDNEGTREGCAVFWSKQRFDFSSGDDSTTYVISDLLPDNDGTQNQNRTMDDDCNDSDEDWSKGMSTLLDLLVSRPDLRNVLTEKLGHVVQILALKERRTQQQVFLANTHLFYHPRASHIRLIQIYLVARQLSREFRHWRRQRHGSADTDGASAVIICGDFNSSLQNAAGKLLVEGFVPMNFRDNRKHFNCFSYDNTTDGSDCEDSELHHDDDFPAFALPGAASSFPKLRSALDQTPPFTHLIDGFSGSLDHVLVSAERFKCLRSAPMPQSADEIAALGNDPNSDSKPFMPNDNCPSDHVSLVCDVELLPLPRRS